MLLWTWFCELIKYRVFKLHAKLTADLQQMHQSHFHSKNLWKKYLTVPQLTVIMEKNGSKYIVNIGSSTTYDGEDGIQAISRYLHYLN